MVFFYGALNWPIKPVVSSCLLDTCYLGYGPFTPSDFVTVTITVTDVKLTGKIGMQPVLPIAKKIKGAARQRYSDDDDEFSVNRP